MKQWIKLERSSNVKLKLGKKIGIGLLVIGLMGTGKFGKDTFEYGVEYGRLRDSCLSEYSRSPSEDELNGFYKSHSSYSSLLWVSSLITTYIGGGMVLGVWRKKED